MTPLLVAAGGAVGACLRFLTDRWVRTLHDSALPWGTLVVNVLGSLLLGFLTGASLLGVDQAEVRSLVGVGFCGALTTYSTFGYDTVRLFNEAASRTAVVNVAATVIAGLASGGLGVLLATGIWA